jgi:hypothetical protein
VGDASHATALTVHKAVKHRLKRLRERIVEATGEAADVQGW